MAKIQAIRKGVEVTSEPTNIGDRAFDNLRFIRETMERSAIFTSVPGYGGMLMGATAIGASVFAGQSANYRQWLIIWLTEAVLAFAVGFLTLWQKSKTTNASLNSAPARKFALCFAPPLVAAIILSALLYRLALFEFLPTVWLTLYGTAVVCGGVSSVKIVPIAGWCFIALGLISVFLPHGYGDLLMGLGFGGLHIIFGFVVARKYGG
ncbi:MAG: hypothetical protein M3T96_07670 [Acidobacteriota bacterium]|nr:hypothetical protein [Acidobacteriota bacterium]